MIFDCRIILVNFDEEKKNQRKFEKKVPMFDRYYQKNRRCHLLLSLSKLSAYYYLLCYYYYKVVSVFELTLSLVGDCVRETTTIYKSILYT